MKAALSKQPPKKTPLDACLEEAQGALAYNYTQEMTRITRGMLTVESQAERLEFLTAAEQLVARFVEVFDWFDHQKGIALPQSTQS